MNNTTKQTIETNDIMGACSICLEVTPTSDLIEATLSIGKTNICNHCATDNTFRCGICHKVHYKSGFLAVNPVLGGDAGDICPTCDQLRRDMLGEDEYICDICGGVHLLSDDDFVKYEDDEKIACGDCADEHLKYCRDCNTHHLKEDMTFLGYCEEYICDECKDEYEECEECGELFPVDEMEKDGARYYCESCYDEDYVRCDCCNHIVNRSNSTYHEKTDTLYCDECWEDNSFTCDRCGETHHNSQGHDVRDNYDNEVMVCDGCHENYYECGDCGEEYHYEHMSYSDEDECHYCRECESKHVPIHEYHYKPDPVFFGGHENDSNKLFYGVEIEVDDGGEDNSYAKSITEYLEDGRQKFVYAKHDGSLSEGFEIVSHPATMDYHMRAHYKDAFRRAIALGYRAHQTDTCGLHVHVGRKGLGDSYEERELTIMKILYVVEKHWDKMVRFSRRSNEKLEEWANRYLEYSTDRNECLNSTYDGAKKLHEMAKGGDRYKAINLNNDNTIEFRLFRGTLKYNTFIATLQFVDVICNIAKESSVQRIVALTWDDILEASKEYKELMQYYIERKLFTFAESDGEEI